MASTTDTKNEAAGRGATSPWAIPPNGWKDVALRAWKEAGQDNISLVASGVAFCGVLAMVPMLGAVVLSYGLIATPETVIKNVQSLTSVMPADAAKLIGEQLANVVTTCGRQEGASACCIALGIALYGAMKGSAAIITALNIAYDEEETRGFVRLNLIALAITVGAVLIAILASSRSRRWAAWRRSSRRHQARPGRGQDPLLCRCRRPSRPQRPPRSTDMRQIATRRSGHG